MISKALRSTRRRISPWLAILVFSTLAAMVPVSELTGSDIIVVSSDTDEPYQQAVEGLRGRLTAEGHTVTVYQLNGLGSLPSEQKSVLIAVGTPAAAWLDKHLPLNTPIGYCLASRPADWSRSERPTFGVSSEIPLKSQFSLIAEALPDTRRLGMLYHMGTQGHQRVGRIRQALPHGWSIEAVAIDDHGSFADAINALLDRDVDLIWTEMDPETYQPSTVRSLLLAALRRGVPVFGYSTGFVQAGSVLGVDIDPNEQGQQLAELILRLLHRGQPTRVPRTLREPAAPRHFVAINSLVADKLAIQFPDTFTARARVIAGEP